MQNYYHDIVTVYVTTSCTLECKSITATNISVIIVH